MIKNFTIFLGLGLVVAAIFTPIALFANDRLSFEVNSGKLTVIEQNLEKDIYRIAVNLDARVYITQGEKQSVKIEGYQNIIDKIKIEETSRSLSISHIPGLHLNIGSILNQKNDTRVFITVKKLEELEKRGSANVIVNGMKSPKLDVLSDGSLDIQLNSMQLDKLNIIHTGTGAIEASGAATEISVQTTSNGRTNLVNLQSKIGKVLVTSNSSTNVNVSEKLQVEINGSGNVRYRGNPEIKSSGNGSGRLLVL